MTVEVTTFDDGLRVVTERLPAVRSVALSTWASIGGRDEPAELAGASHFLEHLIFKGTPTRSAREIAESIDCVGGEMNAFTSREHTAYHVRLPSSRLDLGLELLGDVLTAPAFRPAEVDAERQVILEEIHMNRDTPDDRVHSAIADACFPGHELGREVLGDEDTVRELTSERIDGFFNEWYRPTNIVVAAAGDLHHDKVAESARAAFGGAAGSAPTRALPTDEITPLTIDDRPIEQCHIAIGYRSISVTDEDRFALAIVSHVLGGGMSSRLFQSIREERGLAYSVYAYNSSYSDAGQFVLYAGTNPERLTEVRGLIEDEVDRMLSGGVTAKELDMARGFIEGSVVLGLEDTGARMSRLAYSLLYHDVVMPIDEQVERYLSVSLEDCRRVIDRVFTRSRAVVIVGDMSRTTLADQVA